MDQIRSSLTRPDIFPGIAFLCQKRFCSKGTRTIEATMPGKKFEALPKCEAFRLPFEAGRRQFNNLE
jgi:hypothetical protein